MNAVCTQARSSHDLTCPPMTTMDGSRFHSEGIPPEPSEAAFSPMLPAALCSRLTSCTTPPKVLSVLWEAMAAAACLPAQQRLPAEALQVSLSQQGDDRISLLYLSGCSGTLCTQPPACVGPSDNRLDASAADCAWDALSSGHNSLAFQSRVLVMRGTKYWQSPALQRVYAPSTNLHVRTADRSLCAHLLGSVKRCRGSKSFVEQVSRASHRRCRFVSKSADSSGSP